MELGQSGFYFYFRNASRLRHRCSSTDACGDIIKRMCPGRKHRVVTVAISGATHHPLSALVERVKTAVAAVDL